MNRHSRRILLLHPPYADWTYPYHSLAYVASALTAGGYGVDVLDVNAMWFREVFTSKMLQRWRGELKDQLADLEQRESLDVKDQACLVEVLYCLAACESINPERALDTLRSDRFYVLDEYLKAREQVRAFEKLLSHLYPPYDFFHAFSVPPYEPTASSTVQKALNWERLATDFSILLDRSCKDKDYLFCGVSIPFSAQLVPGLTLLNAVGRVFSGLPRIAGGTAISDIYKYRAGPCTLQPFKHVCDYFYIGEAETGILSFADWCAGGAVERPAQAVDLSQTIDVKYGTFPYVALSSERVKRRSFKPYPWLSAPPAYDWIDWTLYLAPSKRINYSPSRGCFWNKCTFCDYGLNEAGPTAPSRTSDVEVVLAHLRPLVTSGITHVYLAGDAIEPRFLQHFADRLLVRRPSCPVVHSVFPNPGVQLRVCREVSC